jgi:hypothetical protein
MDASRTPSRRAFSSQTSAEGPDVEEDRALFGAASPRDQRREAVAAEAQMPPWLDAVMAVDGRTMGNTRDQSPKLGKLRHTFIHAG